MVTKSLMFVVMNAYKILLVDDDEFFVESNKDLLEAYGYEVFTASNGADGLRELEKVRPDLMILDVMMTTSTEGFDVARAAREIPGVQNIPILLVTGMTKAMNMPEALRADKKWLPVDHILEKPIEPGALVNEVGRMLKRKER